MASSQYSMSNDQKEFLRKKREYLKDNLAVDNVWPNMTHVLNKNDEDLIRAEPTRQRKVVKLLDLLPLRGSEAFHAFLKATYKAQKWLGESLAKEAKVNLDQIRPSAEENPGMKEVHHEMLRSNLLLFQEKLDVVKMIQCLGQAEIITVDNPGLAQAVSEVMDQQTKKKQVEKLICEVLPQLGPNSYDAFITILQRNQPQLAHDFQQSIKESHPDISHEKKCYPETLIVAVPSETSSSAVATETSSHAVDVTHCDCSLLTPCAELPKNVLKPLEECLNKPNEILENDWKRFYKVLKLPEGKENVIAGDPNPTRSVMNIWINRDGRHATLKKLLEALTECQQGGLVHRIEQMLDVELKSDIVDGVQNMHVTEPKKKKAVRKIKDIPQDLKVQFINLLNGLHPDVLSDVATGIMKKRCYARNTEHFLETVSEECKTRYIFRELRKANQSEITEWMRDEFPAGSTGPVKSDDEQKASDMNYGRRLEITRILTANRLWETLASHHDIDMKPLDIKMLKMRSDDPSECVLSRWEVSNKSTVGTMYDLLVDCELPDVADHL